MKELTPAILGDSSLMDKYLNEALSNSEKRVKGDVAKEVLSRKNELKEEIADDTDAKIKDAIEKLRDELDEKHKKMVQGCAEELVKLLIKATEESGRKPYRDGHTSDLISLQDNEKHQKKLKEVLGAIKEGALFPDDAE